VIEQKRIDVEAPDFMYGIPMPTLCYTMSGIFPIFDRRGIRHAVASQALLQEYSYFKPF